MENLDRYTDSTGDPCNDGHQAEPTDNVPERPKTALEKARELLSREKFMELKASGKSDKEIIREFGINNTNFYALKKEYGLMDKPVQAPKPDATARAMQLSEEQFENLREEFMVHEARLLDWKRNEYASSEDRLQNFREVAGFLGQRPAEVALLYLMKHIQSIAQAVRTGSYAWAWETDGGEGLKQRVADARNYMLLLAACLDEEKGQA